MHELKQFPGWPPPQPLLYIYATVPQARGASLSSCLSWVWSGSGSLSFLLGGGSPSGADTPHFDSPLAHWSILWTNFPTCFCSEFCQPPATLKVEKMAPKCPKKLQRSNPKPTRNIKKLKPLEEVRNFKKKNATCSQHRQPLCLGCFMNKMFFFVNTFGSYTRRNERVVDVMPKSSPRGSQSLPLDHSSKDSFFIWAP